MSKLAFQVRRRPRKAFKRTTHIEVEAKKETKVDKRCAKSKPY